MSSDLPRIYSPAEVVEMFSPAVRPTERVLIEKARAVGCYHKIGRKMVFTGRDPAVTSRLPEDVIEAIDAWAAKQKDEMSRSEAIRRLVELGLKKGKR